MARNPKEHACVLFLGQTGLEKFHHPNDRAERRTVDRALASEVELLAAAEGVEPPQLWDAHTLEDYLVQGSTIDVFLTAERHDRQKWWIEACRELADVIQDSRARTVGVFLHAHYWNEGDLTQHINLSALRRLNPTLVITLIDDVFDIHTRLHARADEMGEEPGLGISKIQIPHVLVWRAAEVQAGEFIAENVRNRPLPHMIIAVKHPAITLRRLVMERRCLPVYSSFPITRTREEREGITAGQREEFVTEVDEFRRSLLEKYAVLDPLTIDELRFTPTQEFPRWNLAALGDGYEPMIPGPSKRHGRTDEELASHTTRQAFLTAVDDQVTPRDFRMIDAVGAVAAYRPAAYDGFHSGGTFEELQYARSRGIDTVALHQSDRDGGHYKYSPGSKGTLSKKPPVRTSLEATLTYLAGVQGSRSLLFGRGSNGEPDIWTDSANDWLDGDRRARRKRGRPEAGDD